MRLLVTGGSGYVGAGILRRAPKDWHITATYRAHPIERADVAVCRLDVRDADAVNRLFDEFQPDLVIHTTALMTGDEMMAVNADGSRNVARAAKWIGARLIHLSSDVIFDGEHAPYNESAPPDPITPYAESKARAEQFVREEYPGAIIVRTSLVYGFDPMDSRTRQTLNGEFPRLFTDEYRCPIFADDLAEAVIEIALSLRGAERRSNLDADLRDCFAAKRFAAPRNDMPPILNLAGAQRVSRYEFGVKLAQAYHVAPRFAPAVAASFPVPRPRDCALDIALAQKILRTKLRGVDEVLARM